MESKQTAVDYFFDKIKSNFEHDGDKLESVMFLYAICKEKEREQIEQAFIKGNEFVPKWKINGVPYIESEQYYEQTYGTEPSH